MNSMSQRLILDKAVRESDEKMTSTFPAVSKQLGRLDYLTLKYAEEKGNFNFKPPISVTKKLTAL